MFELCVKGRFITVTKLIHNFRSQKIIKSLVMKSLKITQNKSFEKFLLNIENVSIQAFSIQHVSIQTIKKRERKICKYVCLVIVSPSKQINFWILVVTAQARIHSTITFALLNIINIRPVTASKLYLQRVMLKGYVKKTSFCSCN